ncbi:hypothetical protein ACQ7CX_02195 [Chryseobacterium arthrosphaerae]|uniref:hypothetical protein n=1 Tax=Chryseobacterium arthrosphaerae TaxID=651561 RepID=UPI001BAE7D0B|nr:hypothetical protein [Chryseobacterium arthrosphaerae]QUY57676.1 hypothetical protein I2F65_10210 [Chryseobacterium arthrosphaerae]
MKKELLKQLKSDYEALEIKPSSDLWDRIEQGSPESPVVRPGKRFQWLRYAAVLILLFSVSMLLYFNKTGQDIKTDKIVQRNPVKKSIQTGKNSLPVPTIQIKEVKRSQDYNFTRTVASKPSESGYIWKKKEPELIEKEHIILKHQEINAPVPERNLNTLPDQKNIAKTDYIKADELLLGREFDKKREENRTDIRKFGALDMTKIKIKSPNTLKILGVTVYSDSLESK